MAVLLYQVGIFIVIQIAAMFGKNSRNTAVVLISIFTLLQVFMSWLLILQFFTIIISYIISNNWFYTKEKFPKPKRPYENLKNFKTERLSNSYTNPRIKKKGALDVEYVNDEQEEILNEIRRKAKEYIDKKDEGTENTDEINFISKGRQDKLLKMYTAQAQKHK